MFLLILNILFCLSFLLFAWFNLNDKDSWLWVPIYLAASVCCAMAAYNLFYPIVYLLLSSFYVIYAISLFFSEDGVRDWIVKYKQPSITESMQATKPYIEKTREFFGLLIITAALLINYFASSGV
jgi:Ca2+/Na+ antiporter